MSTTKGALTTNLTQLALGITVPLDFGDARQEGWHHHEHDTHDKYRCNDLTVHKVYLVLVASLIEHTLLGCVHLLHVILATCFFLVE